MHSGICTNRLKFLKFLIITTKVQFYHLHRFLYRPLPSGFVTVLTMVVHRGTIRRYLR